MIVKTYAIKGEEKILVTSQNKDNLIGYEFIQEEMTDEEILENQKTSILKQLGELKLILNGMIEVGEDTTEIDLKINELKNSFSLL